MADVLLFTKIIDKQCHVFWNRIQERFEYGNEI